MPIKNTRSKVAPKFRLALLTAPPTALGGALYELSFRSYMVPDEDPDYLLTDPLIRAVCGDEVDYGKLFAYCFRRFGYPNRGWDDDKELAKYFLATPHKDLILAISPYVGGASVISISFLVPATVLMSVMGYDHRDLMRWDARSFDWLEQQGLPKWMDGWVRRYNIDYCAANPEAPRAKTWREAVGFHDAYGREGTEAYRLTKRVADFRTKLRADYSKVEPYPGIYKRPQDVAAWRKGDPLKPLAQAALEALADLRRPVGVHDSAINAFGLVKKPRGIAKRSASAGYACGAMGNVAPVAFSKLHGLVLKLGRGDVGRGIRTILDEMKAAPAAA